MKAIDVLGKRFGRLVVFGVAETGGHQRLWGCRCDCGTEIAATSTRLINGDTRSCGCLRKESAARQGRENKTHGMRGTPTYRTWAAMVNRCTDSGSPNWIAYGGRGIGVCDRWLSFENFLEDMGERPEGKSIDRINVNGNYEPGNCQWATAEQQNNNRRTSRHIEFRGQVKTLAQWAKEVGISSQCLNMRLRVWTLERSLTTPPLRSKGASA